MTILQNDQHTNNATPLDSNFLFSTVVARSQTKRAISKAKRAIDLKLAGGLALG